MRARPATSILLLAVALLAGGCGTFNHEWKQAGRNPPRPDEFEGRWQGTWVSDVSGHTDQLRCLISQTGDGTYRARFRAKYRKVLRFGYTVPLTTEPKDGGYAFHGKANLGWMAGGVYQYDGFADSTNFHSSYECKYDHGTFQMRRPFQ